MKITVNLATRPFADQGPILQRLRIAMAVFAVVSIGLGFGLHLLHARAEVARAKMQVVDNQVTKINQERQSYQAMMRQPNNAQVLDQAGHLNALFDQKAFSWTLAMEDLETVLPGGVQVTTLEPIRDEKTAQITLKLRVVGPRDKGIELVQNLEHSHHFIHPVIVGESVENNGGPNTALEPVSASNRVNFDLNAEYNSAASGELPTIKKPAEGKKAERESSVGAASAHMAAVPNVGPGLRRPPMSGISNPPPVAQPGIARPSPLNPAGGFQPSANPALQSPRAVPPAGQPRYPMPSRVNPATNPQQTAKPNPGRPGGPQ